MRVVRSSHRAWAVMSVGSETQELPVDEISSASHWQLGEATL